MLLAAFIIAIAAVLAFLVHGFADPRYARQALAVGLTLLTVAWVCQTIFLSGTHLHVGP